MSTTTNKTEARRRAREAKARADEQRAAHEQRVEDATTDYYLADGRLAELREQIDAAQAAVDAAVGTLLNLGERADRVADLTGLSTSDVRAARRRAKGSRPEAAASSSDEAPAVVEETSVA